MPKQTIESHIKETLAGDTRKNALEFVAFLLAKEFNNVCRATMRFTNPDAETVECMKKLVEIRKNHIDFSTITACGECCVIRPDTLAPA